jgi:predicted ribosome quality control (RQC) complex YloA/Tae2 family protein
MIPYKELIRDKIMLEYTSHDGIKIQVGQNAKENDQLTMTSDPKHWWMHVAECSGAHVVVCHEGDQLPREIKRDAMVLAVFHSQAPTSKMSLVDVTRVKHVMWMRQAGKVKLEGEVMELTIFMRREKERLERLLKTKDILK